MVIVRLMRIIIIEFSFRYDEPKPEEQSQEAKNLEKLQKKIELKKLKKKKFEEPIEEAAEEPVEPERKKKKKSKKQEEEVQVPPDDEVSLPLEDEVVEDPQEPTEEAEPFQYTVLGEQKFEDIQSIEMVLPYWLAHPDIISSDLTTPGPAVNSLGYLCDTLQRNLNSMKIKNLFPVQEKLIPWILDAQKKPIPFRPRDVCVSAVTGSGKTLSYAVPIVQNIMENRMECKVRALVMLPVFELAKQVFNVFDKLCNNLKVRCILLSKQRSLEIEQNQLLRPDGGSKVDIIVTTGGRLVEHLFFTKGFSLKTLKFLVIDEADHAMAKVHNDWYHHYNQHIGISNELQSNRLSYRDLMALVKDDGEYKIPQKLLLSATLSQDPEKINIFNLFQPKLFTTSDNKEDLIKYQARKLQEEQRGNFIGKYTTPAELTELYCITEYKLKPLTLFGLIKKHNWRRFLCFTNTVESSHRLSFVLQTLLGKEFVIEELSSLLPMRVRQKVLQRFSNGEVNGLICSDALARGIDVPNIEVVVSYDLPKHLKIYIHRIGRTARAGHQGSAITMIAPDQIKTFEKLLETASKKSVAEIKPEREVEEANALNYANVLKKLQKALELEERERKKISSRSTGLSLFEKLQRQVKQPEVEYEILPEAWKPENIQQGDKPSKADKKQKKKALQNKTN